jgi:hypothetical protein
MRKDERRASLGPGAHCPAQRIAGRPLVALRLAPSIVCIPLCLHCACLAPSQLMAYRATRSGKQEAALVEVAPQESGPSPAYYPGRSRHAICQTPLIPLLATRSAQAQHKALPGPSNDGYPPARALRMERDGPTGCWRIASNARGWVCTKGAVWQSLTMQMRPPPAIEASCVHHPRPWAGQIPEAGTSVGIAHAKAGNLHACVRESASRTTGEYGQMPRRGCETGCKRVNVTNDCHVPIAGEVR